MIKVIYVYVSIWYGVVAKVQVPSGSFDDFSESQKFVHFRRAWSGDDACGWGSTDLYLGCLLVSVGDL